jgi:hypothetical protein
MGIFGAIGSAFGMGGSKNKPMQGKGLMQQPGLGPSMGMMGGMMRGNGPQQGQMPGMRMGQQMGLGGYQQQRQIGKNRQMPMKPRQDMQDMAGQIGMSSTRLPDMNQEVPRMEEPNPEPIPEGWEQPKIKNMQDMFGQGNARMHQMGGGLGPRMGMMARNFGMPRNYGSSY